jgi:hypothetical protein
MGNTNLSEDIFDKVTIKGAKTMPMIVLWRAPSTADAEGYC